MWCDAASGKGILYLKTKENLKSSANYDELNKKSNEPNYDEDQDQLEEEQEEQTGSRTTNQVF